MTVEVVGYWLEVEIMSLTYDRPNMMIKVLPGRTDPQLPKKGNITAKIIEELVKCEVEKTLKINFSFSV